MRAMAAGSWHEPGDGEAATHQAKVVSLCYRGRAWTIVLDVRVEGLALLRALGWERLDKAEQKVFRYYQHGNRNQCPCFRVPAVTSGDFRFLQLAMGARFLWRVMLRSVYSRLRMVGSYLSALEGGGPFQFRGSALACSGAGVQEL